MGRNLFLTAILAAGGSATALAAPPATSAPGGTGVIVSPQPAPGSQVLGQPMISPAPYVVDESDTLSPSHPRIRQWMANHRREPYGIPHPMGAGNAWTEFKFVFGSNRQFMGTAESSEGVWCHAQNPPPYLRPQSER
jgi:hypothetical protein